MSLTTIPIQKETRNKLRDFAKKSESWDALVSRLYENALAARNAEIFFSADTFSEPEALKEIEKWQ